MPSDLAKLAQPFPRDLVQHDPSGNDYVAHENVTQWLLGIVGPFTFELVEIIRGDVAASPPDPKGRSRRAKEGTPELHNVIVGGVWRLTLQVDGRTVRLEEAGDVEDPHNWKHDGQRLKQAASDAIKRCAMRAGLGLHLWAQTRYVLDARLRDQEPPATTPASAPAAAPRQQPRGRAQHGPAQTWPRRERPSPDQGAVQTWPADQPDPEVEWPGTEVLDDDPTELAAEAPLPEGWATWEQHNAKVAELVAHAQRLADDDAGQTVVRLIFTEEAGLDPFDDTNPHQGWALPFEVYQAIVGRVDTLARSRIRPVGRPATAAADAAAAAQLAEMEAEADLSCTEIHPEHPGQRSWRCTLAATHVVANLDHEPLQGQAYRWSVARPPQEPPAAPAQGGRVPTGPAWRTRPRQD